MKRVERAFEQAVGDDGVPAGDDDGEGHSGGREVAFDGDWLAFEGFGPLPEGEDVALDRFDGKGAGLPEGVGDFGEPGVRRVGVEPAFGDLVEGVEAGDFDEDAGDGGETAAFGEVDEFEVAERGEEGRSAAAALVALEVPSSPGLETERRKEAGKLVVCLRRGGGTYEGDAFNHVSITLAARGRLEAGWAGLAGLRPYGWQDRRIARRSHNGEILPAM